MNLNTGIAPAMEMEPGVAPTVFVTVCGSALLTLAVGIFLIVPGNGPKLSAIDFEQAAYAALKVNAPVTNKVFGWP